MSEFFKLAYELISQIIYYLVEWVTNIVMGFVKLFITGWAAYIAIFSSYFEHFSLPLRIFAVLLALLLVAIPVTLLVILVKRTINHIRLKMDHQDDTVLLKEIGRLNRQVLGLMDEKNKILAMKVNAMGGVGHIPYVGASALLDDTLPTVENVVGAPAMAGAAAGGGVDTLAPPLPGGAAPAVATGFAGDATAPVAAGFAGDAAAPAGVASNVSGNVNINASANIGDDTITNAAAAAVTAAAQAQVQAEEQVRITSNRFAKLSLVDAKYADYEEPHFDNDITLQQFTENYRLFAASNLHLYYTPEIVRRFVAGMAASKLLILEGISGTGKTSLPYSFSRYLANPCTMVSVQPSFRDRTELLGYFNEFSKRFNETEFLRAVYEAGCRKDPSFIVLDEMNLARIEYYFAEMLSVLEMPSKDEWVLDLVPTAWPGDPARLDGGKIHVPGSLWFVGTANNDDSTFTITDKVYDRAIPIELNQRAAPFECPTQPVCNVTCEHLEQMFATAKLEHPISEATRQKLEKLDTYLQTRFKLAFGNRIIKQMNDFVPVYMACGGTELGAMDYIIARKVLKKFESMNVSFVRDEIKDLIVYIERTFGRAALTDSKQYL
ncbi:MAG: hypothetical protein PHO10_11845, partial [Gemmiger sp.]|nr:hypothetical protein [Gemmiger sp.]